MPKRWLLSRGNGGEMRGEPPEPPQAPGRARELVDRVLAVGHQPEYVAVLARHAGHVAQRAVRIRAARVAQRDLAVRLDALEQVGWREPAAGRVLHGHRQLLAG